MLPLNCPSARAAAVLGIALCYAPHAGATEGALGRPVSGTAVQENSGVVPDVPIWAANLGSIYMNASIGTGRQVPIEAQLSAGIDTDVSLTLATLLKVWDTGPGRWNFESSISLPYAWEKVTAHIETPQQTLFSETQQASNLFDLFFTPITAGYHISKTENVSFGLGIWTPTGKYDKNNLANPSLNNWTFVPTVNYTKMLPEQGLEIDTSSSLEFYTRNTATDYQNAPLFTTDILGIKKFPNGFAAGVVIGWVQQLGDDSGPTADKLDGFKGYDISVGPYLSYATKLGGKMPLSFSFRWDPTVASKNRLNGNAVLGSITAIF
jgi:hypothetical protein